MYLTSYLNWRYLLIKVHIIYLFINIISVATANGKQNINLLQSQRMLSGFNAPAWDRVLHPVSCFEINQKEKETF